MPKCGKKLGKGVVSEKQREGDEFFRIQFPFPPLFVGTDSVAVDLRRVGLVFRPVRVLRVHRRVVVFAAWKHHYSAWEKRADGRTTAGRTCCNDR